MPRSAVRRSLAEIAVWALLAFPARAAEIVSTSAKNIGLAKYLLEIVYTHDVASDPANAVYFITMHPENGGPDCVALLLAADMKRNGTVTRTHTCAGVPYGTRYLTVYLQTVNGRGEPPPQKVRLKE